MNNDRISILRDENRTRAFIAAKPGEFPLHPNYIWERRLSDIECEELLYNPWCMHNGPRSPAASREVKR